jgi:hypothetical protein
LGSYVYFVQAEPSWATGNDGPGWLYDNVYWPLRYLHAVHSTQSPPRGHRFRFAGYSPGSGWVYFEGTPRMWLAVSKIPFVSSLKEGDLVNVRWTRSLEATRDDYSNRFEYVVVDVRPD